MKDFNVYIISHKRALNVKKMEEFLDYPCTWIVGEGEQQDYLNAGALNVIEGGKLCASRNLALDLAFKENRVCIQLSDDIKKIEWYDFKDKRKELITFKMALQLFKEEIFRTPFFLYGIPPTANEFFVHKPRTLNAFCIGDFIVVKPCDLRFDDTFLLKEDYDYTAQHIKKIGTLRFDDLLVTFQHYNNEGGAVSYRNDKIEAEMVQKLMTKHKGLFRKNPKRENEVLLVSRK